MCERYSSLFMCVDQLMQNPELIAWLAKQIASVRAQGAAVRAIVRREGHPEEVSLVARVLKPFVQFLRLLDGKKGASLSKIVIYADKLIALLSAEIVGVPTPVRQKMLRLFQARYE
jgi:hypothetical protein